LKTVRYAALEYKEIVDLVHAQNAEMQSLSCDKLKFMVELENENKTLKRAMAEKVTIIETKVTKH